MAVRDSEAVDPRQSGANALACSRSMGWLRSGAETRLNIMHDRALTVADTRRGGLTLTDSPAALDMVAELPAGDAYDSVLSLVGDGLTRGLLGRVPRA